MTADEYEAAKTRLANLQRKLAARKTIGEGYTTNAREMEAEIARLAGEIAEYEANGEEG